MRATHIFRSKGIVAVEWKQLSMVLLIVHLAGMCASPLHAQSAPMPDKVRFVYLLTDYSKQVATIQSARLRGELSGHQDGKTHYTTSMEAGLDVGKAYAIKTLISGEDGPPGTKTGVHYDGKQVVEVMQPAEPAHLRVEPSPRTTVAPYFQNPLGLTGKVLQPTLDHSIFHLATTDQFRHDRLLSDRLPKIRSATAGKGATGDTLTAEFDLAGFPTQAEQQLGLVKTASLTLDVASGCPVRATFVCAQPGRVTRDEWTVTSIGSYRVGKQDIRLPEAYEYFMGADSSGKIGYTFKWKTQSLEANCALDARQFTCDPRTYGVSRILDEKANQIREVSAAAR